MLDETAGARQLALFPADRPAPVLDCEVVQIRVTDVQVRDPRQWGDVFGDRVTTSAILDRTLHHATTISIRGDLYRLKDKLKSGVVKPTTAGP